MNQGLITPKTAGILAIISFITGLLSIFLWEFSIIPIIAITTGAIALTNPSCKKPLPSIGLAIGILYLIVRIATIS